MKIAVFGAGTMGSGIAQVFAGKGHTVLLYASSTASAQRHKDKLAASLNKRVAKGKMTQEAADDLMSRVFDKNIKATELLLRIILGKKVKVISVTGQNEMKNHQVGGRNITLDVDAMDENGEEIDIEVQGNSEGAHVRRARYHSSMVDSRMLKEGQAFRELKDSYVIFIYKHDKFRKGLPLYHVERYVGETNEQFRDGSHIIYVNGNYKGNDEIGQLMQDFWEKNPECMHYTELAESVKHFKEKEGGREEMSEIVERYGDERALMANITSVQNLMNNMKWTLDQALDALGIKGKERTLITQQLQK
mgnify:CR=1 FL=1